MIVFLSGMYKNNDGEGGQNRKINIKKTFKIFLQFFHVEISMLICENKIDARL